MSRDSPMEKFHRCVFRIIVVLEKFVDSVDTIVRCLGPVIGSVGWAIMTLCTYCYFQYIAPGIGSSFSFFWLVITAVGIFILSQISYNYVICSFADPGYIAPSNGSTKLTASDVLSYVGHRDPAYHLLYPPQVPAEVPMCTTCNTPKPRRVHHCNVCRRCVIRMDHHCPWINNCVGVVTHSYFLRFLAWAFVGCVYFTVVGLPQALSQREECEKAWATPLINNNELSTIDMQNHVPQRLLSSSTYSDGLTTGLDLEMDATILDDRSVIGAENYDTNILQGELNDELAVPNTDLSYGPTSSIFSNLSLDSLWRHFTLSEEPTEKNHERNESPTQPALALSSDLLQSGDGEENCSAAPIVNMRRLTMDENNIVVNEIHPLLMNSSSSNASECSKLYIITYCVTVCLSFAVLLLLAWNVYLATRGESAIEHSRNAQSLATAWSSGITNTHDFDAGHWKANWALVFRTRSVWKAMLPPSWVGVPGGGVGTKWRNRIVSWTARRK